MSASDDEHMAQAIMLARRGLGRTWPNPSVGAIVVRPSGKLVGRGWTAPGGRPHAEAIALEQAGAKANDSTIYVTLEPCAHEGRGPACADIIVAAKPNRVVIGLRDPDRRTAGRGVALLHDAGIEVDEGVLADEAGAVTLGHVMRVTHKRPAVTLKLAVGSDGLVPGATESLSGQPAPWPARMGICCGHETTPSWLGVERSLLTTQHSTAVFPACRPARRCASSSTVVCVHGQKRSSSKTQRCQSGSSVPKATSRQTPHC